jgi:UrcA family protein
MRQSEIYMIGTRRVAVRCGFGFAAVLAATLALAPVAYAQDPSSEDFLVTAPREVGRSPIGAPIIDVTVARPVSYRDLDMLSPAGWAVLRQRITATAREQCQGLEQQYPIGNPDSVQCAQEAVRNAQPAIQNAIRRTAARSGGLRPD